MKTSLAVRFRPVAFSEVTEQKYVVSILENQLQTGTTPHALLFVGPAGTGKTTCARILANNLNKGAGNPIELDAASNNGVEDVRNIIQQARTKPIDSPYKVFIIDECHAISSAGFQAFLKLLEEPPAFTYFIFCTTDPQKIPATIISRVQRFDFQKISKEGIYNRLEDILEKESEARGSSIQYELEAIDFIAQRALGGMRDAITTLEKCLTSVGDTELTLEETIKILGEPDYEEMALLFQNIETGDITRTLDSIDKVYKSGRDIKQFIARFADFVLDINIFQATKDWELMNVPKTESMMLFMDARAECFPPINLLNTLVKMNSELKWSTTPLFVVQSTLLLYIANEGEN